MNRIQFPFDDMDVKNGAKLIGILIVMGIILAGCVAWNWNTIVDLIFPP